MGSIPITRSTCKINYLADDTFQNTGINSDFRHKRRPRCNPHNSAILRFTLFGVVASLWRIRCERHDAPWACFLAHPGTFTSPKKLTVGHRYFSVSDCVSIGYTPPMAAKDSGLRIRVERPLREAFLEACREHDKPAAQVIREFMRGYVARHTSGTDGARTRGPAEEPKLHRNRTER